MQLTREMEEAFKRIEDTRQFIFITGKAGTGKTTFLKYLTQNTKKSFAIAAPTGVAAVNCKGVTLHSLFTIPLGVLAPNEPIVREKFPPSKIELYKNLELLIIDEISMVRPDVLDYIDRRLRLFRMVNEPFGGVQVVMFGDLYQLPPVIKKEDWKILKQYYGGGYFFHALVWRQKGFHVIEFTQIFRQKDEKFVRILNNIREYVPTWTDFQDLDVVRDRHKAKAIKSPHIHLCTYRSEADKINRERLGEPTHTFQAVYTDRFNPKSAPCDETLSLRVGARVMMLTNSPTKEYFNGSMGEVIELKDNLIIVKLDNGNLIPVTPYTWEEYEYKAVKGKVEKSVKGTCTQYPLTLGWAITIHKSQGLTFDKVVVHANRAFAPGQLYTALSRCTSMDGLITDRFIAYNHIIPDHQIHTFFKAVEARNGLFDLHTYQTMRRYEGISIDPDQLDQYENNKN